MIAAVQERFSGYRFRLSSGPAALGAVLNDATIPGLRCRVVCGGANNQLAEARHDAAFDRASRVDI